MELITKDRVLIIITFIVISLIMLTYSKNRLRKEPFNQTELCDSYLKEAIHRYPCSSPKAKRNFLDWCNSYRRRHGIYPSLPDSFTKFYRIRDHYLTYDVL